MFYRIVPTAEASVVGTLWNDCTAGNTNQPWSIASVKATLQLAVPLGQLHDTAMVTVMTFCSTLTATIVLLGVIFSSRQPT